MLTTLYRLAATWTVVGLLGGLYYREFTKSHGHPGGTQLAVVHTHALALGTIVLLVLLALVAALPALGAERRFVIGVWIYQAGLAVTTVMQLVKGTLQVLGESAASAPAVAGLSGLGHMTLSVAFLLLFLGLGAIVASHRDAVAGRAGAGRAGAGPAD